MIKENRRIEEVRVKLKKADELKEEMVVISNFLPQDRPTIKDVVGVKIELLSRRKNENIVIKRGELFDMVIYPMLDTMEAYLAKKEKEWKSFEI